MGVVSILFPVFNAADTLPAALASVRAQTHANWEMIALDDGSTDDTPLLLTEAADHDPRIVYLRRPHRGLVSALNEALRHANGPWLARFDADDLMHPDRLRLQRAAAFDGVLGCGVHSFGAGEPREGFARYESWLNGLLTHEQIVRDLFVESPFAHPSVMLPARWLRKMDGYRDVGWAEDYDLWLRLWRAGCRFAKLPQVLHEWRDEPTRLSRRGGIYNSRSFRWCKAAFLRETFLSGDGVVTLWGAGKVGRVWSRVLTAHGVRVARHIDSDAAHIGGFCRGRPVVGPEAAALVDDGPILVCVGVHGAREAIRAQLDGLGKREWRDYLCVA
jgi:glycosyltransferase involved in cell wall biosynthesis